MGVRGGERDCKYRRLQCPPKSTTRPPPHHPATKIRFAAGAQRCASEWMVAMAALIAALLAASPAELVSAAEAGDRMAVQGALHSGTHVDAANDDGYTALHVAARDGHAVIVQQLLKAGADVDIQYNKAWSALAFAAEHANDNEGGMRSVVALLNAGANPLLTDLNGYTAMMRADPDTPHREIIVAAAYKRKSREGTWAGWQAEDEAHQ